MNYVLKSQFIVSQLDQLTLTWPFDKNAAYYINLQ